MARGRSAAPAEPTPERLPFPPMEAQNVQGVPRGRRLAVRAQVGRFPRRAREPRRRASALESQRQAAVALLPGATRARHEAAARVCARRGDRDRARRRSAVRLSPDAPAPRGEQDQPARGRDSGAFRRVRRAPVGGRGPFIGSRFTSVVLVSSRSPSTFPRRRAIWRWRGAGSSGSSLRASTA